MQSDSIAAIGIDDEGALWVKPATATFPYIYREAMEVQWDAAQSRLHGPKPRQWTYPRWFRQIVAAAHAQGVHLTLTPTTAWTNVDDTLRQAIIAAAAEP